MGRKKKLKAIENVHISDIAAEGKSVAKVDNMVIFVQKVVPGDVVDIQVIKKRRNYLEAIPTKFHKYSEDRQEPICSHFGPCGGCKWQNLKYEKQLVYKQKQVVDAFERIGKIEIPELIPILASPKTEYYRNKMGFTFSNNRWLTTEEIAAEDESTVLDKRGLGFHLPGRWDKILDIEKCYLQRDPSNRIREAIKDYGMMHNLPFFDLRDQEGFLRLMTTRIANTNDIMLIIQFYENREKEIKDMMEYLKAEFPEITSLNYVINPKGNDTIYDLDVINYSGHPYIVEEMEGLSFRVGPKSFFQTNSTQAYNLYCIARDFADASKDDVLYDLYTGTGTIALFMARSVKEVIGIESVAGAIEDAHINAKLNDIQNAKFYVGDMKNLFNDKFLASQSKPDVIITDPPRAGMHEDVCKMLLKIQCPKIVYVSCNPATQARDIAILSSKYKLEKIQPVDMFPHTTHVENVALLTLK
ncbi:23S rRNA (uracil(1939)-C(5))-methyltransferase RlmD [Chondrinema litorale]|uniref:23S rRNA (uracil(1939)-C(5))-methyltransferase RlmD n=1 Tax=Chondrinema litorale TaxID=2994555 RepID=UPI0025442D17|nr:23S rRNA (uracil(1939)-C(5))-methyltransferase RlmD [Chondrinema litorale]UZR94807.1 23S rRNA (uracil(1939)-C(5))-methyltransferase RlmD [Chondrinema litorale]